MSRNRKILLIAFIAVSVAGMWARHSYEKSKRLKMENTLRSLATSFRENERAAEEKRAAEARANYVEETRDMFDSALPQESLDLIRQKVGQDFRLLEVWIHDKGVTAKLTTDGKTVNEYRRWTNRKNVDDPVPVRITGDGKIEDVLLKPGDVDLSLVPKLAKEAKERAALPDSKVSSLRFNYSFIRYAGEGPEWSALVETGKPGENWQSKHVTFDAKGKFKKVF
ncbi:MAG TPA: hypothetical protein VIP46_14565 [Pyrinomonadaceae bacterium]